MNKKVSNLLLMVEFLHGMLEDFKRFQPTLEKIEQLNKERGDIDRSNFHGRKRHEQIKREILELAEPIKQAITEPIKRKVAELNVCDWDDDTTVWNWNINDVEDFKREAQEEDATLIMDNYQLYKELKAKASLPPFTLSFFSELDTILNELYSYFIQETKADAPEQMDLGQAIQEFKQTGYVRFTMPIEEQANDTPTTNERPQLPKEWLKMFYREFSECLNFNNEAEFITHVQNWESLRGRFKKGMQTTFAHYIQQMIEKAEKLEIIKGVKTPMMESFGFGRSVGKEKVSKQPDKLTLVEQLDAFLAEKCT